MTTATDATLEAAFNAGEILRTHVLRPTWHFVTPADIRWMLALTGPRVHALNAHMYRQQELDADVLTRAESAITEELSDGSSLTRKEIGTLLERRGIVAAGVRLGYIMMHAELNALVCSGPLKGKQQTYALLDMRTPNPRTIAREEALAELVRRFFRSHGPATIHDFTWWSGLTVADARAGIELASPDLESLTIDGRAWWSGNDDTSMVIETPCVRLLPNYDEYYSRDSRKSGYPGAELERQRAEAAASRLFVHHLVIDGAWRGGWRRHLSSREAQLELDPLVRLTDNERAGLEHAAESYGLFLDRPITIR